MFETVQTQFFAPANADSEADAVGAFAGTNGESRATFELIEARLQEARDAADTRVKAMEEAGTKPTEQEKRPTLEDYHQACINFSKSTEGKAQLAQLSETYPNLQWNERSYANLSGQLVEDKKVRTHDLSGFFITEPPAPQRAMTNVMNLDSDGAINDFYTNIDFTGANLKNAYVDPATSFNDEIAKAGNLDGLTFNNMSANDPPFVFGAGNYTNIHMTKVQDGAKIIFGDNSRVTGLTIQGTSATVTMGDYAKVSDVTPLDGFSMMNLSMGEGSFLEKADLTNATISQASEFSRGATLQDVQLGRNVSGVDFSGVTFKNVTFNGSKLDDTSFAGATLNGVAFNNVDVNTLDLSGAKILDGVKVNNKPISSAYDLQMMQLAGGITIPTLDKNLNNAPSSAPIAQMAQASAPVIESLAAVNPKNTLDSYARADGIRQANAERNGSDPIAAAIAAMVAAGVSRGEEATSTGTGTAVAVLKRPERDDVANLGSGNMQRSSSGSA